MQRILQPGEIETLDRTRMPHARLPQPASLFRERAARLLQKADGNPIGDYLRFIARLVQAQAQLVDSVPALPWPTPEIERAHAHAMPLCNAIDCLAELAPHWHAALHGLLDHLLSDESEGKNEGSEALPDALRETMKQLLASSAGELDALAQRILGNTVRAGDLAAVPLVMAALQLVFAQRASVLDERDVPYTQPMSICPVCGSQPVASVLRVGGADGGLRFLHCGTCCTEWHMVRVKCSHCESTAGIAYQNLQSTDAGENLPVHQQALLAETCDQCHTYRKLVNQEKDPLAEPLADDLASLTLDLLMAETAFSRASANPLLALGSD